MGLRGYIELSISLELLDLVKNNIDWDMGIVVNLFCASINANQLAGWYFPICDDYVLYHHEEDTVKFTSLPVTHDSDALFIDC